MDIYQHCPEIIAGPFLLRLVKPEDSAGLFSCYHDPAAVARMNEDNCDFGFYTADPAEMAQTVAYWLASYEKRWFVRFALVDQKTGHAVGTVEGFDGETGVLRLDLAADFERAELVSPLLAFAEENFSAWFGNKTLVTKAAPEALERRKALESRGWRYIGPFRGYEDYYERTL